MNELDALRDACRGLLSKQAEGAWGRLCSEIGVAGLLVPESYGGAGAGMAEACIVQEELGRTLTPAPMLSTILATQALLLTGNSEACQRLLPGIANGSNVAALVWSEFVLDAGIADTFLVVDGDDLLELDRAQVAVEPLVAMDESRHMGRVKMLSEGTKLGPFSEKVRDMAIVALAAEQVGAAERAFELTVEYTKSRVQFGRPIGSFQALQHRMADLHVLVETARSAYLAALVGEPSSAAVAKVHCSEAFQKVAAEMIQLHGGIGITWEHDAHRYFKRAHGSAELFGHPRTHVARLASHVLD
ncbi:MAG TPA: acyl-CoA dehydrogenase [Micromonosporaceae bacterium]|nr:acyl-CoA dehydrogenase [Micromonosporaceae bacterium]HCU50660.1 acyl-CoA dehydrogenase [Micromonosporaceae bacterium]